jgi:APA family basic amino acid/polyamine antiporter
VNCGFQFVCRESRVPRFVLTAPRTFRTPLAPVVGTVAIVGCVYLFFSLPTRTEVFFLGWNAIGLVAYFVYGRPRAGHATESAVDPDVLPEKPVLPAD